MLMYCALIVVAFQIILVILPITLQVWLPVQPGDGSVHLHTRPLCVCGFVCPRWNARRTGCITP